MTTRPISQAVALATAALALATATARGDDAHIEQLVRSGQLEQATQAIKDGDQIDATRAAALARTLLAVGIGDTDATARLYALRAAARVGDPGLLDPARPLARSPDRYEQAIALDLLVRTDPNRGRDELLNALTSPYRAIRLRGVQGLSKLRDPSLVDRFDAILVSDPDPDLRLMAVRAIIESGASDIAALLHRGLDDAADTVREESVKALVQVGDRGVSAAIRRHIADAPATDRRAFALRLAGLVPDKGLLADITPYLANANPQIRAAAAGAVLSIVSLTDPARR